MRNFVVVVLKSLVAIHKKAKKLCDFATLREINGDYVLTEATDLIVHHK